MKKKVLVADDTKSNRMLLEKILQQDFEVFLAKNGDQVLELLHQENEFSLLVLDLIMPGTDGFAVLEAMKKEPNASHIPVLVVTATKDVEREIRALDLGASDLVVSPYDPRVLRRRARNLVEKQELERMRLENAVLMEQTSSMERIRYRADHDALTGLYNREAFCRETTAMLLRDTKTPYVLVRWNIEQFKIVNDLFGMEAGDRLLRKIADSLRQDMIGIGTFGRLEADHFALCFPAELLDTERMQREVAAGLNGFLYNYTITMSSGIYMIEDRAVPVETMCDRAAMALAGIKGVYGCRYAFYDDVLRSKLLEEQEMIGEMERALTGGEFVVYLQPVYRISKQCPVSAEALVRWQHPKKGLISPEKFIPVFERSGFISKLDAFVREKVCCFQKSLIQRGLTPLPISVNVSRKSLYDEHLAEEVIASLQQYELPPWLLRLEITEGFYTSDEAQLHTVMKSLQDYGFCIMMDDFGSGYSSLNMLKDVPVDILKIDMKFLEGFETSERAGNILTSVIRMAKWLNLPVIAEGVETKQQVNFLSSIGCDYIQGYYFAKPMDMDAFTALLENGGPLPEADGRSVIEDMSAIDELFHGNMLMSSFLNSVIGAIGIYELTGENLEALRVNDAYFDLFGYDPQTFYLDGISVWEQVHPEDRPALLAACKKAVESRETEKFFGRRYRKDQSVLWLDVHITCLKAGEGTAIFCMALYDVTEQKMQVRQIPSESLQQVLYTLFDEVLEFDFNQMIFTILHCIKSPKSVGEQGPLLTQTAMWAEKWVHPNDRQKCLDFVQEETFINNREKVYPAVDIRIRDKNGLYRWASVCLLPAGGRCCYYCVTDIQERRDAERLEKENLELHLQQQQQLRYRQVVELSGAMVLEWDIQKRSFTYSEKFQEFEASRLEKKLFLEGNHDLFTVHPEDTPVIERLIASAKCQNKTEAVFRLQKVDGTYHWCHFCCMMRHDMEGNVMGVIGALFDIDAQMRLRQQEQEEKQLLQLLANKLPGGMICFSPKEERLLYVNGNLPLLLGYEEKEMQKKFGKRFFSLIYGEDRRRLRKELSQEGTYSYRMCKKDGTALAVTHRGLLRLQKESMEVFYAYIASSEG